MKLVEKLAALKQTYLIYDNFIGRYRFACEIDCSACCTCNVTMTTLEAYRMFREMSRQGRVRNLKRLVKTPRKRFRPKTTFNKIAVFCIRGEDVPEETCDPSWGGCPFLEENRCVFYEHRPFGCRCMSSKVRCSKTGFAEMPPLAATVNDVFMQVIEHLDADGYSGNFTDILKWIAEEENRIHYENGERDQIPGGLVPNVPMPALMVPPEHRKEVEPILAALRKIISG